MVEEISVSYSVGRGIDREEQEEKVGDVAGTFSAISILNVWTQRMINARRGDSRYHLSAGQSLNQEDKRHY